MGTYNPQRLLNRRKRLFMTSNPDSTVILILSVFLVMLTFFIILVAISVPNENKAVGLMTTLEATFRPVANTSLELAPPAPLPDWLASSRGGEAPLATLRTKFPDAFTESTDSWGGLLLRFTPDRFQAFVLDNSELARTLFAGLKTPVAAPDDYILEVTIGIGERSQTEADALRTKTLRALSQYGVDPSRALIGYEPGTEAITLRMTTAEHYRGAL